MSLTDSVKRWLSVHIPITIPCGRGTTMDENYDSLITSSGVDESYGELKILKGYEKTAYVAKAIIRSDCSIFAIDSTYIQTSNNLVCVKLKNYTTGDSFALPKRIFDNLFIIL